MSHRNTHATLHPSHVIRNGSAPRLGKVPSTLPTGSGRAANDVMPDGQSTGLAQPPLSPRQRPMGRIVGHDLDDARPIVECVVGLALPPHEGIAWGQFRRPAQCRRRQPNRCAVERRHRDLPLDKAAVRHEGLRVEHPERAVQCLQGSLRRTDEHPGAATGGFAQEAAEIVLRVGDTGVEIDLGQRLAPGPDPGPTVQDRTMEGVIAQPLSRVRSV